MRSALFAACFALAPGPLVAGSFDLSLDEIDGARVVVIARADGGLFAVAAGGEDLQVLKGEEAARARARLADIDREALEETAADEDGGSRRKKIVIHKVDIHEDETGAGDEDKRVVRIIKHKDGERREETRLEDEVDALMKGDDEAEKSVERKVIRLKGADAARAIKFIDDTGGLDDGEKAEMKATVGL